MYKSFDCYNILPALKQELQFDAHELHLALVLSLMSKADNTVSCSSVKVHCAAAVEFDEHG